MSNLDFIREHIPRSALWDQLGEELAELLQALYKSRRACGNGSPTPVTVDAAIAAVQEEISDVVNCCKVIGIPVHEVDGEELDEYTFPVIVDCIGAAFRYMSRTRQHWEREYTVSDCICVALTNCKLQGYSIDFDPESPKLARWVERIKEAQNG